MVKPAINLANKFVGHLIYLEKTRTKMEYLLNKKIIVRRDIEQVYAGLFMDAITSLERFIENLFIGLLVRKIAHSSPAVLPNSFFNSYKVARSIVFGGKNYVDWLPYNHTEERANAFFKLGLPFTSLDQNDIRILAKFGYIRNAIAHKSEHSRRKFEQKVIGSLSLISRERTPAGYLRSTFRAAPTQNRYEEIIIEMSGLSRKLC